MGRRAHDGMWPAEADPSRFLGIENGLNVLITQCTGLPVKSSVTVKLMS
jgi:hypothetical protein